MRRWRNYFFAALLVLLAAGALILLNSTSGFQPYTDLDRSDKDNILLQTRLFLSGETAAVAPDIPITDDRSGDITVFLSLWPAWEMADLQQSINSLCAHSMSKIGDGTTDSISDSVPPEHTLRIGASGPDYQSVLDSLKAQIDQQGISPRDLLFHRIQIDILRDAKPISIETDFYINRVLKRGLSGVAWAENGKLYCALPDEAIRLELSPRNFISRVKKRYGIPVDTQFPEGLYRFRTDGFIERWPGGKAQSLYRAGARIDGISSQVIQTAYLDGGDFLLRLVKPDGKYYYRYYPIRRKKTPHNDPDAILGRYNLGDGFESKSYNLLRHCGTTYSLMQLYDATKLPRYKVGGERALRWMVDQVRPMPGSSEGYVIAESRHKQAKLGGAGLAILALVTHARATGDMQYKPVMEGLANGICELQLPNGDFQNYVSMVPGKPPKRRRSIYYPGEAILGLIRLYQFDNNEKWLEHAVRGADFLVRDRWTLLWMQTYVPPDAWLMLALEELHEETGDPVYRDYAYLLANNMIKDQFIEKAPYFDWQGGYSLSRKMDLIFGPMGTPRVTPAGSRMEGLTAVYLLAEREQDQAMMDKIYRTIKAGCTFQISSMIRPETAFFYPDPAMATGGFRHTCYKSLVQIDYNQHNISGLIVARQIMERRGE